MDTSGRTALVTGGATGLGRAITRRLASSGDRVVIVSRNADALAGAAEEVNAELGGDLVTWEAADLTDPADVAELGKRLPDRIDALVLNAGGTAPDTGEGLAALAHDWLADYRLNVLSAVLTYEAVADRIPEGEGRIVAMSSVAALRGAGSYGAAKGALNVWATDLAGRLAPRGITVNAIAPGFVPETGFWDDRRTPELVEQRTSRIPMARSGTPDEIAALVAHLVSREAGFTTGQVIGIHGGTVLARL
jgi:3-oxoacyl-[acyl-carrier protein] reductase